MKEEINDIQNENNNKLNKAIDDAASVITKNYLSELEDYEIVNPSINELDIKDSKCEKFYKLSKLVYNKEENFLNKLTTIVNVVSSIGCTLSVIIKSDGMIVDYYFGIISKKFRTQTKTDINRRNANNTAFQGVIEGNLIGSDLQKISNEEFKVLSETIYGNVNSVASISGIVGLRDEDDNNVESYVQGIENLVDSLRGQKYTIMLIADPINSQEMNIIKQGYEELYTNLALLSKNTITYNEGENTSLNLTVTKGLTKGTSKSTSRTSSKATTNGFNIGTSFGSNAGISAGGLSVGESKSVNLGYSHSTTHTDGKTETDSQTKSRQNSDSRSDGIGTSSGKTLQMTYENRSVKSLLDKIDANLTRLEKCENFGAFSSCIYVVSESRDISLIVASNYNALMRGEQSFVQSSQINVWYENEKIKILKQYLMSFTHPKFKRRFDDENLIVTPATITSGNELAIQVALPKKSISGVTVINMAPFGRNTLVIPDEQKLFLGNLYHMGHDDGNLEHKNHVNIDIESLSMHTFITGSTGAGKSTVIYSILEKLMNHKVKNSSENIKFLVVEPAKGEYKDRFGNYDNVHVYGTNSKKTPLLRINPFSFPDDIHVLEHIDRIIEIFNACWPMYAAMPAVLKDAIERSYVCAGWDLNTSECKYKSFNNEKLYPSFVDVLEQIDIVVNDSQYSGDSKSDYKGALCTRVRSLTTGLYGHIFTNNEISGYELFDRNVIIDLSRVGSSETKSLIMGIIIMKLQEYRMSSSDGNNLPLRHITVLEEAHNILKRVSTSQSSDSSNLAGKSVEMLSNSIAEMRTYGEGFIIADQAPELLDLSAIRNTNTKIILRLPDYNDRELVGRAASLNDEQIIELSRLKTFVAAVYQNNWLEPILCNIDKQFIDREDYQYTHNITNNNSNIMEYVSLVLKPLQEKEKLDKYYIDCFRDKMFHEQIPVSIKTDFIDYLYERNIDKIKSLRKKIVYGLFNSKEAIEMSYKNVNKIDSFIYSILNSLEPKIDDLEEVERNKIIIIILNQFLKENENKKLNELLNRFVEKIKNSLI